MATDNAWEMVTCSKCGRTYQCTPHDDYYNATTTTDGVCSECLTADVPSARVVVVVERGDELDVINHGKGAA